VPRGDLIAAPVWERCLQAVRDFPVITLGRWPSPLQCCTHPTIGPLLVKRDDLAGFGSAGRSGVKARKLEGFLGYVQRTGYRTILIPLPNATTLAFDLIPVARRLGLAVHVLVVDTPTVPPAIRRQLFDDVASHVELCGASRTKVACTLACRWLSATRRQARPIAVLPSPAHPAAIVGAARGYLEMVQQRLDADQPLPRAVYIATAAGATAAGFILAEALRRRRGLTPIRIVPVQVAPSPLRLWLRVLFWWTWRFMNFPGAVPNQPHGIEQPDGGVDYGIFDDRLERVCEDTARNYGFEIDPVYGAKSWQVMERMERGTEADRPPLFWHCGYAHSWTRLQPTTANS
jgi:1-aminocyclopropane-1-carboxylate deaminase/D-cysteine desulfhydrase-like pyridoxal-dependent ACC family enzyme